MPDKIEKVDFVVVGDGPSAVQILEQLSRKKQGTEPMHVVMICQDQSFANAERKKKENKESKPGLFENPEDGIGRGRIGKTLHDENCLNVRASGMSGDTDPKAKNDFVDWLIRTKRQWYTRYEKIIKDENSRIDDLSLDNIDGKMADLFMPRNLWGTYMNRHDWLKVKEEAAAKGITIYTVFSTVDLDKLAKLPQSPDGLTWPVVTSKGEERQIQGLVTLLAFGLPGKKLANEDLITTPALCKDPYNPPEGSILREKDLSGYGEENSSAIVGGGLTGYDMLSTLLLRGYPGKIYMFSPQKRLLRPHTETNTNKDDSYKNISLLNDGNLPKTAQEAYQAALAETRNAEEKGYGWQVGMDHFRKFTKKIWQGLGEFEKNELANSTELKLLMQLRHRGPQKICDMIKNCEVIDGVVKGFREADGKLHIKYQVGMNEENIHVLEVNQAVKATGWAIKGEEIFEMSLLKVLRGHKRMVRQGKPLGIEISPEYRDAIVKAHQLNINENLEQTGLTEGRAEAATTAAEMLAKHTVQKKRKMVGTPAETRSIQDNRQHFQEALAEIYNEKADGQESFTEQTKRILKEKKTGWQDKFEQVRLAGMAEVNRQLPGILAKFPNLLMEEEKMPRDPYIEGGYRKVFICIDKENGIFVAFFILGPGQGTPDHDHPNLGGCASAYVAEDKKFAIGVGETLSKKVEIENSDGTATNHLQAVSIQIRTPGEVSIVGPAIKGEDGNIRNTHRINNLNPVLPQPGEPVDPRKVIILAHVYDGYSREGSKVINLIEQNPTAPKSVSDIYEYPGSIAATINSGVTPGTRIPGGRYPVTVWENRIDINSKDSREK